MGSVAALSSVKITTAALLGHFLLGEALGRLHMLALLLVVGGAVLIWDPETISASDPRVLGNTLALGGSGISSGCVHHLPQAKAVKVVLPDAWIT